MEHSGAREMRRQKALGLTICATTTTRGAVTASIPAVCKHGITSALLQRPVPPAWDLKSRAHDREA